MTLRSEDELAKGLCEQPILARVNAKGRAFHKIKTKGGKFLEDCGTNMSKFVQLL